MNKANKYNVIEGTKVRVNNYCCLPEGSIREVKKHSTGELYIECNSGIHFIEPELDSNDIYPELTIL